MTFRWVNFAATKRTPKLKARGNVDIEAGPTWEGTSHRRIRYTTWD